MQNTKDKVKALFLEKMLRRSKQTIVKNKEDFFEAINLLVFDIVKEEITLEGRNQSFSREPSNTEPEEDSSNYSEKVKTFAYISFKKEDGSFYIIANWHETDKLLEEKIKTWFKEWQEDFSSDGLIDVSGSKLHSIKPSNIRSSKTLHVIDFYFNLSVRKNNLLKVELNQIVNQSELADIKKLKIL